MALPVIFHYRKGNTILSRANPLSKLAVMIALCFPLFSASLGYALFLLAFLSIIAILQRLPLQYYLSDLRFFLFLALFILLTDWLSESPLSSSITSSLRFLDFIFLSILFTDSTDVWDLSRSLAPVLDKIPFVNGRNAASTLMLTLSLVPMIGDVTSTVIDAQKARMASYRHPIRFLRDLVMGFIDSLFQSIANVADALDSRLYDPERKMPVLPFHRRDLILLLAGALLTGMGYVV